MDLWMRVGKRFQAIWNLTHAFSKYAIDHAYINIVHCIPTCRLPCRAILHIETEKTLRSCYHNHQNLQKCINNLRKIRSHVLWLHLSHNIRSNGVVSFETSYIFKHIPLQFRIVRSLKLNETTILLVWIHATIWSWLELKWNESLGPWQFQIESQSCSFLK